MCNPANLISPRMTAILEEAGAKAQSRQYRCHCHKKEHVWSNNESWVTARNGPDHYPRGQARIDRDRSDWERTDKSPFPTIKCSAAFVADLR